MTMNNVAVLFNNQAVEHLTRSNKTSSYCTDATMSDSAAGMIDAAQHDNRIMATAINPEDLHRATSLFEKALALILQSAEVYRSDGGLQYFETDGHGMIQYEDEFIGPQLIGSLNLQDTGIKMNELDDESFIHWKVVKIGTCDNNVHAGKTNCIDESKHDGSDYRHLSTTIFHSMVCIYNLGLCYQYKGIQTSARHLLEAAVDHYMQAYELGTRFRLQHIDQYTLLMATMNNMATTYSFLNEPARRDVCNNYLLSTLMLLTTSEEGQENHRAATQVKDTLSRARQSTYQSFMSNVMYLISEDNVASAA
jgi:hypothetical protein